MIKFQAGDLLAAGQLTIVPLAAGASLALTQVAGGGGVGAPHYVCTLDHLCAELTGWGVRYHALTGTVWYVYRYGGSWKCWAPLAAYAGVSSSLIDPTGAAVQGRPRTGTACMLAAPLHPLLNAAATSMKMRYGWHGRHVCRKGGNATHCHLYKVCRVDVNGSSTWLDAWHV